MNASTTLPPDVTGDEAEIQWTDGGRPFVRTPDEAFADLPGFGWSPSYAEVDGMRMHYVDAGDPDGEVVLLLHGQPDWSYLYRRMIPILADAGFRVIAPDHFGFGRSDKPVQLADYTFLQHVAWNEEFLDVVGLRDITPVVQDWGSLIGLRFVSRARDARTPGSRFPVRGRGPGRQWHECVRRVDRLRDGRPRLHAVGGHARVDSAR